MGIPHILHEDAMQPELFIAARDVVARLYPGVALDRIDLRLANGAKIKLSVPACDESLIVEDQPFVPTPFQMDVLDALDGKALRTDALANKVGDRSRLFRKPGGLDELRKHGLIAHHQRLGYYRPDAPPVELAS